MPEPSPATASTLRDEILTRLDAAGAGDQAWPLLVLAALDGPQALEDALSSSSAPAATLPPPRPGAPAAAPRAAYVTRVQAQGFRGIGGPAVLELTPGPGLTLVLGRNGSGKSSFAEALELLLTGDTWRWSQRNQVWREGWRNLHHAHAALSCELALEGEKGACTVTREWPDGGGLGDDVSYLQVHGQPRTGLEALGWQAALQSYRPFLSYNELGSMLDEGPSKLFDALRSILGLEDAVQAQRTLAEARKRRDESWKLAGDARKQILEAARAVDDPRAARAAAALGKRDWGLDEIDELLAGATAEGAQASEIESLRRLALLSFPDQAALAGHAAVLRQAAARAAQAHGTLAGRAHDLAELLDHALRFHTGHGDGDCPVCGSPGALDAGWHEQRAAQAAQLRDQATEAASAQTALQAALKGARSLAWPARDLLAGAPTLGLTPASGALAALDALTARTDTQDPVALADALDAHGPATQAALVSLREAAQQELQRREDRWRPLATQLAGWSPLARQALRAHESAALVKEAETWLKAAEEEIRNQRFTPIADHAREVWGLLRQQSNVALEKLYLGGQANRRHVEMEVTVDGVEGAALGVMSQGELNALALSLFVPRATLPGSPFRFMVIDDPVQSMDPSRVEGLARLLDRVARDRQVIVFTHDDRLPEAARRLGLPARVVEVTRREKSQVEVTPLRDPVSRYLDDALAVARTESLPEEAGRRVVPGLCRMALEAGCSEAVRRRRLGRGERHADVELLLERNDKLYRLVSLALFDDAERSGDVLKHLNKSAGSWAADLLKACNEGAHEAHTGPLLDFVRGAEKLAGWLQKQK